MTTIYFTTIDKQYGFRSKHNTTIALFDFITEAQNLLDTGSKTAAIFIDLSKAFDTVDIAILIHKLQEIGIGGVVLRWFQSYLSGRSQYVSINESCSTTKNIRYGVPQGSVLGLLLFLIYINNIKDLGLDGSVFMYADDIALLYGGESYESLENVINRDMKKLSKW